MGSEKSHEADNPADRDGGCCCQGCSHDENALNPLHVDAQRLSLILVQLKHVQGVGMPANDCKTYEQIGKDSPYLGPVRQSQTAHQPTKDVDGVESVFSSEHQESGSRGQE